MSMVFFNGSFVAPSGIISGQRGAFAGMALDSDCVLHQMFGVLFAKDRD
jgi:hypothetical protein